MKQKRYSQDRFNFFVPLGSFEKAEDAGGGKVLMRVKGIASTLDEDSDGEELDPVGFDVSELLSSGMANWNHQASKTSSAICGIPVSAKLVPLLNRPTCKGLELEIDILNNSEGRSLAELIETLDGHPTRKIGLSIEGRKTEVDPFNPKRITKAKLSGVAFTHVPKNKNTFVSILKGEYSEPFVEDELEEEDEIEKMDTAAIAPTIPESVEGAVKNVINKKITNFDKELVKKSDIYTSFLRSYPNNIADLNTFYSLVKSINTKIFAMADNTISAEALQKAFDLLDEASALVKSNDAESDNVTTQEVIEKSEDGDNAPDADEVEKALPTATTFHKAGMDKDTACDYMVKSGISLNVAQGAWESVIAAANASKEGDTAPTAVSAPIVKSEETTELHDDEPLRHIQTEIQKALEPMALEVSGTRDAINKGFNGINTIIKSLQQENAALSQRLEAVEKTPMPKKSITGVSALSRFEKSENGNIDVDPANCFNVKDKGDLSRLADRLLFEVENTIEKGGNVDPLLEGTINSIEINGTVPEYSYQKLASMGIKLQMPA